ncbi:unnamed protein product [Mytilus coruscus]|uniref:Uncharacterized protein n=1 Tax=Mytilus coruscus TaxID=42192 RepID=A0A6J8DFC6_MYTCO|nr:unnamed protein product [Mytilus coruscus]
MASSSLSSASQSSSTNFARISYAAQQIFPNILQELMTIKAPPHRLLHDIKIINSHLYSNLRPDELTLINDVATKGYQDFNISFIYKLVRNLRLLPPPTKGWNNSTAPCQTELTPGDDFERIRKLRNEILHRGNAQVTDAECEQFFVQFKDIAGRLETYLGKQTGEFVDMFSDLETRCMDEETRDMYIQKLSSLKKSDEDCKERLNALEEDSLRKEQNFQMIHTKIAELARTQDEVIPKNVLEDIERRLKQWKEDDEKFVITEAEKQLVKTILTESCITIIGNSSGTGKSFLLRHVALKMIDQGYMIIPCDHPGDIRQWFKHGRKTVFVFEDVCGRYTLNQQFYNKWNQRLDHITSRLEDKSCKIMSTCRLQVYKNE